jgi:hypothetical protein
MEKADRHVAWEHIAKAAHPSAGLTAASVAASAVLAPKAIVPARDILTGHLNCN